LPKVTININKFLGINEQGNTQLQLGEAQTMTNFRLVDEYKPRVIEGYKAIFNENAINNPVRGMWYGEMNGNKILLVATGGKIYELKEGEI